MVISLLDFLRTGQLGGIELGMSLDAVKALFGESVKWDGSFSVSLWFERDELKCLELEYGFDPDGDTGMKQLHEVSSSLEVDLNGINLFSNFSQILKIVEDCDLISAEEVGWLSDTWCDEFNFKSGIFLRFYEKDIYPMITVRLGKRTNNSTLLKL